MDFSTILSVGLGVILLFSIVAFVASALAESVASVLGIRATQLKRAVSGMLGADGGEDLYGTTIIGALGNSNPWGFWKSRRTKPSYIDRKDFTAAVASVVGLGDQIAAANATAAEAAQAAAAGPENAEPFDEVAAVLGGLPEPLRGYLGEIFASGSAELGKITDYIGDWFDSVMERTTGWYKRWVSVVLFAIAFALAAALNLNTIVVADALWGDPLLRAAVEAAVTAQLEPDTGQPPSPSGDAAAGNGDATSAEAPSRVEKVVAELERLEELNFPVGWTTETGDRRSFNGLSIVGWIITAAAATLGAPFWFDVLKKVANLRGAGVPPSGPPATDGATE